MAHGVAYHTSNDFAHFTRKWNSSLMSAQYLEAPPSGQVPCTYHPKTLTGLRCTRCGKPICPQCAVRGPVGLRCPDCAGVRGLPTYRTSTAVLAKATAAGLLVAIVTAILWRQAPSWGFYLALILGFGSVEAMARVANNKRGFDLQLAAIAVVTLGLVLSRVLIAQRFGVTLEDLNNLNGAVVTPQVIGEYGGLVSATDLLRLRFIPDVLFAGFAYAIAWYRFR